MPKFSFVNIKKIKYLWFYALAVGVIIFVYYNFRIVEGAESRKRLELKKNDRISVYWENDDEWYNGTVGKVHKNGDIDINYDDGDNEENVTPWVDEVKKITKGTNKQPIAVAKDKNSNASLVTDPTKSAAASQTKSPDPKKSNEPLKLYEYGSYYENCQAMTLTKNANNQDVLQGTCFDSNEGSVAASIVVTPADKDNISNCNGVLTRGSCP
jgi:hypothetical protein